jgi:hypothetical protein
MWRWDQGHNAYTQFPNVRRIAEFVASNQFVGVSSAELLIATGLEFKHPAKPDYNPWRQYARALKVMLLVSEEDGLAIPTAVAKVLKNAGAVTSDEYLHFLAEVTTDPSPAFRGYDHRTAPRYPLLFALKYLLAKTASGGTARASRTEIRGAYKSSSLTGAEHDEQGMLDFIALSRNVDANVNVGKTLVGDEKRQINESLSTLSQISYLHKSGETITVSLSNDDCRIVFVEMNAIQPPFLEDPNLELQRRARLFSGGSTHDFFDFPTTIVTDVVESGFVEGTKFEKTHVVIERNRKLREQFFKANPSPTCSLCRLQTRTTYGWADRVLDMHHLLPLAAGTRTDGRTTALEDLVAVCPSCHRAIHRYYGIWLRKYKRKDFNTVEEARAVYDEILTSFSGAIHV